MTDGKLFREHVRRRILENLSWGQLPYRVIEPLPAPAAPPSPPDIPAAVLEKPPPRRSAPARRLVGKWVASIPFLGKVALVCMRLGDPLRPLR